MSGWMRSKINCVTFELIAPKGKPSGGDVWVLLIQDTKPSDSNLYVCEVNTNPPVKSFHQLKGIFHIYYLYI